MAGSVLRKLILFSLGLVVLLGFGGGEQAQAATLTAKIDLSKQRMTVYENGKRRYSWRVSTGKRGWRTPTGQFTPVNMYRNYYSKRFRMSLPHSVVLTYSGIAIHGTSAVGKLGRPASHGCIRLAPGNAAKFFKMVNRHGQWNTRVTIHP